jgi:hypothetical protein
MTAAIAVMATDVRGRRRRSPGQFLSNDKKERETMTEHKTGTREEWLAARLELLVEVTSP